MKYILLIILSAFSMQLFAQQKQFAKGDNGKFIYYKVVDSQAVNKATLQKRALHFVNDFYKKQMKLVGQTDSSVFASGKLIIDKTVLVIGHPSGEVKYNFMLQTRDGKYRYWLTDFEFIPYKRDRYGNFTASTTVSTPLETAKGKLNAGEWKAIQASAYDKAVTFGESFEKYLATDITVKLQPKSPEVISTKEW
ncbi:DUF4468 domain-containing protein [Pedobacter endophyticus]|uniref:DUF4468 domain-containing protein n=1 Tax=Pedobacter endophyticus TaxID=2789740 RepID=A0A7S9KYN8_9SPHI|nr:DUF4468 domain-containing protein [Pedobacter endophyticus]QPH39265.1 DUF4468 domain-containing protein [Pedobacter endophyticus]